MAHSRQKGISSFVVCDGDFPALSESSRINKGKSSLQSNKSLLSYSDRLSNSDTFCLPKQPINFTSSQQNNVVKIDAVSTVSASKVNFKQKDDNKNKIVLNISSNVEEVKKKKKNRKSQQKRQAEMRKGKISLVTPEVYSKINPKRPEAVNSSIDNEMSINVHDALEYPELGTVKNVKKNQVSYAIKKCSNEKVGNVLQAHKSKVNQFPSENDGLSKDILLNVNSKISLETKVYKEGVVHPNDPIRIPFFDMCLKSKAEEIKKTVTYPLSLKNASKKPHNMLDSTPVAKRGKERENPKVKKPSHMKKIILMDRKNRKEQQMQLKLCTENLAPDDLKEVPVDEDVHQEQPPLPVKVLPSSDNISPASVLNDKSVEVQQGLYFPEEDTSASRNQGSCSECVQNNEVTESIHSEDESIEGFDANECGSPSESKAGSRVFCDLEINDVLSSMLNATLHIKDCSVQVDATNNISDCSEEERLKAAKILLHTRNFREYCTHLPSKEIDDAVSALLTDLIRFQDRLHHKDPVKARIRRRVIYGIKEVKKHMKLGKVKCIILATDIENVQTEGGLNDVLFDMKQLASDHHVPCIYALRKRKLGKLCNKPVAVSCLGILNYEGSEVNFKKILEFLHQSTEDYQKVINEILLKLSDEEIRQLLKARLMAPETLCDTRVEILRKTIFQNTEHF